VTGLVQIPSRPPFDPDATPVEVALTRDRATIRLTWRDGAQAALSASRLRSHCRCAWCTRDRALGCFPVGFEGITIKHLEPMGGYAVHLAFSDEHARGIFPWAYLRDLATEAADTERPTVRNPSEGV
jgi:DUF971 family protein